MKRLILALVLVLSAFASAADSADSILKKAYAESSKSHRPVLLIFHASWCGWCHKLDDFLARPDIKPLFDKSLVVTHLDVMESATKSDLENKGGKEVLSQYGGAKSGLPFMVIIDAKGKKLIDSNAPKTGNTGFPAEPAEVAHFISMLDKAVPKLTKADKEKIKEVLTTKK